MLNKTIVGLVMVAATAISSTAMAAGDRDFNTGAGAVIGAVIGNNSGGAGGAVVGGVIGAAVGNSLSSGHNRGYGGRSYVETRVYQPAPVYYAPPPQVYYAPPPRYYAPAPEVVYVERGRGYRERDYYYRDDRRGDYHHGRGHDRGRGWDGRR